jgi:biopolymer transport protein ExbB
MRQTAMTGQGPPSSVARKSLGISTIVQSLLAVLMLALIAAPTSASAWWQKDWPFRKEITLDASAKGGDVLQPAGRVAVLLRLHTGNFTFKDASANGDDLRFVAEDDKTPLAFHVESFDPTAGVATVWVDVPQFPVGAIKKIWMYYGNKKAPAAADAAATFDPDFTLVYHFDGAAGAPPTDKTANHNTATSNPPAVDEASIIGKGAKFTGAGGVSIPASPSLAAAAGAPFTFSAWVKSAAPQPQAALYVRRDGGASTVVGLDNGVPFVEIRGGSGAPRLAATQAITPGQWAHIAFTADGKVLTLYVDGRQVATAPGALPASAGAASLGSDSAGSSDLKPFVGSMDEVRLSKIARPAAAIQVDASTQGAESKLIAYGEDQKQAGIGFGTLGLIVAHVDAPAWFIISLLGVLAVGSWWVMYTKITYVNRVDRQNAGFLEFFHEYGGDPVTLEKRLDPEEFENSSLFRVYHAGASEMSRRVKRGQKILTAQGVEVVRSLMNTQLVRENQRLSSALVVLTIAISGGPFLGLLGTVVGVMITFADIAAAGDVNINAIAPGISAALLATIAGLAVAIPALFAYNYILLRNKNVSANMLTFVDEFATRISETNMDAERLVPASAAA